MGRFFKWIAIIILAVSFIGTVFGMDDDTVVFLGEISVLAVILDIGLDMLDEDIRDNPSRQ